MKIKRLLASLMFFLLIPSVAFADFFGGDLPLLAEIVVNTLQQITQLTKIINNGKDTLNYFEEINRGLHDALKLAKTMNDKLAPGVLSELQSAEEAMSTIEKLYGRIPRTSEAGMQRTLDQSAAEAVHLHNQAFRYAAQIDPEAERIKEYARVASPQGAEKLTAQSVGVLIHVVNQVLRTNAALLKIQSEQLALQNRKEKLSSEQFRVQYDGLSKAFGSQKSDYKLPSLRDR